MAKTVELMTENGKALSVKSKGRSYTISFAGQEIGTFKVRGGIFLAVEDDIFFKFEDRDYALVVRGKKLRLATNARYIDNGETFTPAIPEPKWVIVFHVLNWAMVLVALGGLVPVLLALVGSVLCAKISKTRMSVTVQVLLCTAITVALWAVFIVFVIGSVALMM